MCLSHRTRSCAGYVGAIFALIMMSLPISAGHAETALDRKTALYLTLLALSPAVAQHPFADDAKDKVQAGIYRSPALFGVDVGDGDNVEAHRLAWAAWHEAGKRHSAHQRRQSALAADHVDHGTAAQQGKLIPMAVEDFFAE